VRRRSVLLRMPFAVAMLAAVALLVGPAASSAPHPGPLDHFRIASIGDQTAGAGFTVTATAEDASNIPLGSHYTGTPALSGTLHGSAHGCPDVTACSESYGNPPSVLNGVATWTGVTGYLAESGRTVTATGSGKTGTSDPFAVGPNVPDKLTFEQQPTDTQPTLSISPDVQVLNEDHYGNPEVGVDVTMSLTPGTNGSGGTLSPAGSLTQAGDSLGVSAFTGLSIDKIQSDHKLRASSGTVNQDSAFFNIANKVSSCAGSCIVPASDDFADITVTVSGGAAAVARRTSSAAATGYVSITLEDPRATCSQIQNPAATGDYVTVNPVGISGSATIEVSGTFLHRNNKGGVGKFIFCKNKGPETSFHVVPNCNKLKTNAPCMVKVTGSGAGDVTFIMRLKFDTVANSWDPAMDGGH
jgi:hypothetical protein